MRQFYIHIIVVLFSLHFISCSNEDEECNVSSLTVTAVVKTRNSVSDKDYFAKNDKVGVFIYGNDGNVYSANANNAILEFGEGFVWQFKSLIEITSRPGMLYAYSPYSETVSDNIIPIETNSQIDYLFSTGTSVSFDMNKPNIEFEHALCQIVFNFSKANESSSSIAIQAVTLSNDATPVIANEGNVNLKTGDITSVPHQESTIKCTIGDSQAKALVFPCDMVDASTRVKVSFSVNNQTYERYLTNEKWEHGMRYTYNVTVDASANTDDLAANTILLYIDPNSTISPWEVGVSTTSFTSNMDAKEPTSAVAVDLGLPSGTKWANRNVGAYDIYDFGHYFAWGECSPKTEYTESNYQYKTYSGYTFLGHDIAGTIFDVAHKTWGSNWQIPNRDQWFELFENCSLSWTIEKGVEGVLMTGKNNNTIFLPAAEYKKEISNIKKNRYWTSTWNSIESAYYLEFDKSNGGNNSSPIEYGRGIDSRTIGCPIRPVCK